MRASNVVCRGLWRNPNGPGKQGPTHRLHSNAQIPSMVIGFRLPASLPLVFVHVGKKKTSKYPHHLYLFRTSY